MRRPSRRTIRGNLVAAFGFAGLVACTQASTGPATGTLRISVTTPSGVTGKVVVTGPGGYQHIITGSQTLSALAPGQYVLTAANVVVPGALVSTIESGVVTGSPVTVLTGGDVAATVAYGPRPGSGAVWIVGNIDTTTNLIYAFSTAQLQASGAPTPARTLQIPHAPTKYGDVDALAFDSSGNLWLGHYQLNTVTEVPAAALATSGVVQEAVTISGPALMATQGLTFDAQGDLWVSNNLPIGAAYTIVEYAAAELSTTGSPTPAVTIGGAALQGPEQMAFDAQGDLWVANSNSNTVIEYTPTQLASSGNPVPAVTLGMDTAIGVPISLAFDRQGNLWVANTLVVSGGTAVSTLASFPPSALSSSGSPAPTTAFALPGGVPIPWQLAFDNSGDLWVVTSQGHSLLEYTAAALSAGGSPVPTVTISLGSLYGAGLAFDPHPPNVPLH